MKKYISMNENKLNGNIRGEKELIFKFSYVNGLVWQHTLVILANWEAEIGGSLSKVSLCKISVKTGL
jgi:hypothetical protein